MKRRRAAGRAAILALALGAAGCAGRTALRELAEAEGWMAPSEPDGAVAPPTVSGGAYTAEQGQRGAAIYAATCALCHKPDLSGSPIIPALAGAAFLERWSTRTAGDLFERMRSSMPPAATARLTPAEYADVLAYILEENGFPAGGSELPDDYSLLSGIAMASPAVGAGR